MIACVGSREIESPYADLQADFVRCAVDNSFTVASGFALGADSISHEVAAAARGKTICVMPGGLDRPFPPENKKLWDELLKYENGTTTTQVTDLNDVISAGSNVSISGTTISASSGLAPPSDEGTAADRLLMYNQSGTSTSQLTGELELPGKLSINTAGANTACFSIGGGVLPADPFLDQLGDQGEQGAEEGLHVRLCSERL